MPEPIGNKIVTQEDKDAYEEVYNFFKEHWKSPAHVVALYDDDLQQGNYSLHKWQAEASDILAKDTYTSANPLELCVQAVNGSGKDRFVIAPFEAFFLGTKKNGTITTTSSSGTQLTNQTEKYIVRLCQKINNKHGFEVFDIKQRHIICNVTGSELHMFATDEAGKAEGYHPIDPNAPFAIIINEAKSIKPEIFEALTRCTGFQYWIEISSPGKPEGHFYQMATSNRMKKSLTSGLLEYAVKLIKVSAKDCPHLMSDNYIERLIEIYGESSHIFKSMVHAEFSSGDEQVVLSYEKYDRCVKFPAEHIPTSKNIAGLDLSGGGDEQVLTVRNGNKVIGLHGMHIKDAVILVKTLISLFEQYQLQSCPIYADGGGMGITIIQMLWDKGWKNVKAIYNNSTPNNELAYKNNGTEMWFNLSNLYENQSICFADVIVRDSLLKKQLCNRHFNYVNTVAQLESKPQAKAKGHPSPDRADSLALCFLNYKTPKEIAKRKASLTKAKDEFNASKDNRFYSIRQYITNKFNNRNQFKTFTGGTDIAISNASRKDSNENLRLEINQTLKELGMNN
jgi:hypothetical protein